MGKDIRELVSQCLANHELAALWKKAALAATKVRKVEIEIAEARLQGLSP